MPADVYRRLSMQAIARRARNLSLITPQRYKSICVQIAQRGWRKNEPVEILREPPRQFQRLIRAHLESDFTFDELARLLFVTPADVSELVADYVDPTWMGDGARLRIVR